MTSQEIIESLEQTLTELDTLITSGEYHSAIANAEYLEQKRKFILAEEGDKFDGSEAFKRSQAEKSQTYLKHLLEEKRAKGEALRVKATKDLLERRCDVLRSMLSHDRFMLEKLT